MKHCIINYADSTGWYPRGQTRLQQSLKATNYSGDFIKFNSPEQLKCKSHKQVPYGYKTYAIMKAYDMGYDVALYVDASIWAIKQVMPCLQFIKQNGWLFEYTGYRMDKYCNDQSLQVFGITRQYSNSIKLHSAGFTGLNFRNEKALSFINKWHQYSVQQTTFKGCWSNHRHDQTSASFLAHSLGMNILQPTYMNYYYGQDKKYTKQCCFYAQGM